MCVDVPLTGQVADDLRGGEVAVEVHDESRVGSHGHEERLHLADHRERHTLY